MKYIATLLLAMTILLPSKSYATFSPLSPVQITFKKVYDELMGFKVDMPVFSDQIVALEGKEITVKGYIVPTEGYKSHKEFILSAFPYNMCFFCGGAGPETVMEVVSLEGVEFSADPIVLKGILRLNDNDINHLMYKLEEAVIIEED